MFLELEKLAPKVVPLLDNIIDSLAGLAIKTWCGGTACGLQET